MEQSLMDGWMDVKDGDPWQKKSEGLELAVISEGYTCPVAAWAPS